MGTQRIASELMGAPFDADGLADPPQEGPGGMEKTQSGSSYPSSGAFGALSAWSSFDTLLQRLDITTDPNFWDGLQSLIPYQDYFLESQYHDLQVGCEPGETQQGPNKTQTPNPPNSPNPECLCANSPFYAWEIHGIECNEYRLLYWYHPDYLGHNEFITDNSGLPYQYFHYSAFGETLVEDNAHYGQFSSPYRFNAKELDQETGNYYYGARYYNPTWSVWLSVDAMASKGLNITPYAFSHNNPIMLVDPDGNWPDWFDDVLSAVGNAFSSAWSSMTNIFQQASEEAPVSWELLPEVTVSADVTVDAVNSGGSRSATGQEQNFNGADYLSRLGLIYSATGNIGDRALESGSYTQLNGRAGNFNNRPYKQLSQWAKTNKTFAENLSKTGKLANGLVFATATYDFLDDGNIRSSTLVNIGLTSLAIVLPVTAPFVIAYGIVDLTYGLSEEIDANFSGINTGIYDR